MIDVAYGFPGRPYKRAQAPKVSLKFYAPGDFLYHVRSYKHLDDGGSGNQDIIQALEHYATRHGVPADIYVDNGSQLKALEHTKFTVSDVSTNLHHNQDVKIHVSNAKAHQE